jgi:hypothetical protein
MHRLIQHNAAEVRRLHAEVHATWAHRAESAAAREVWQQAAAEFHRRYDALAFPGGLSAGLESLSAGEPAAIEAALSFLEVRPYFFRSQYIATKLRRLLKHLELSNASAERLQHILSSARQRPDHAR